jgi:hypothetical protein
MHMTRSENFHILSVSGFEQVVVNGVITISEEHFGVVTPPVVIRISPAHPEDIPEGFPKRGSFHKRR